ncbi:type I restriction enzyme, S subunit [Candidatus Electrothrix aarhusensis]|uniref:Type I restriction enzyme, S subunit n=1 Tax=Candidatus Electrothrix aarhusensis TaxID=1859131 RepID=A0A444IY03_9BACT|nr:type I restriction enzyme, S subunit [Candidatus Electrothrix aarhusensis]
MKGYPTYRDSGVAWIGAVPEHWEVVRLGSQFFERRQKVSDKEFAPLSVTKNGIVPQLDSAAKSNDGDNRKKVCRGDFVINSRSDRKGSSGVSPYTGSVSLINTVLKPLLIHAGYIHNFFRNHSFQEEFYRVGRGIHADLWSTKYSDMATIMMPVPPKPEQQQIARYLDWQTTQINKFITAKKRLIALLKEQKQNIINEAVTKGIDPDVTMKDSGVEWLGEIPAHWECAALRHKYQQCLGKMLDSKKITGDYLIPYLRNTDVQWNYINTESLPKMDIRPNEYERYTVQPGDLLVCEGGEIGRCAIWNKDKEICGFQKAIHRLRPVNASRDLTRFMYYALNAAAKSGAFNDGHVSTIAHLTGEKLRSHRFAFPPKQEQQAIVEHIEKEATLIDQTITRTEREIELIQEYRTRLVSDVVTGKIDVRSVAIPEFEPAETDPNARNDKEPEDELVSLEEAA